VLGLGSLGERFWLREQNSPHLVRSLQACLCRPKKTKQATTPRISAGSPLTMKNARQNGLSLDEWPPELHSMDPCARAACGSRRCYSRTENCLSKEIPMPPIIIRGSEARFLAGSCGANILISFLNEMVSVVPPSRH